MSPSQDPRAREVASLRLAVTIAAGVVRSELLVDPVISHCPTERMRWLANAIRPLGPAIPPIATNLLDEGTGRWRDDADALRVRLERWSLRAWTIGSRPS